jgi:rfaE bifunctional protein nucleotidyltransferase chain/domain
MQKLEVIKRKILEGIALDRWLSNVRFRNKTIVFTNGCFDILHRGHIEYLSRASDLGDFLIIGLNTDASVKRIKGPSRPYLNEGARALALASMGFVAAIVLFDEETPYELIKKVQPDFLVKGGDYRPENIVGFDVVKERGGKILTIPLTDGYSSTGIINKISGKT